MEREKKERKLTEMRSCIFEKISKTDKPLSRLMRKKKESQITKIGNVRDDIITDTTDIK